MEGPPYLVQRHDFTIGLLDLPEFLEEVPEAGLGHYRVRGKQTHTVELGGLVDIRRELAPDDLVFLEATWSCCQRSFARDLVRGSLA